MRFPSITARAVLQLSAAALFAALTYQVLVIPRKVGPHLVAFENRLAEKNQQVGEVLAKLKSAATTLDELATSTYWDNQASAETAAAILRQTYDLVVNTNANLNGGKDAQGVQREGVLRATETLLTTTRSLLQSLEQDVNRMFGQDGDAQKVLASLDDVLKTLDTEVKRGGTNTEQLMSSLDKAVVDLDKLIADPSFGQSMKNLDKMTGHLAGSAESVDIALRPLREKARLVKLVLLKAIGLFRIVINHGI